MNDTINQQERLLDLAWLAGLWEGEGCFSLFRGSHNRIYAAASLVNTDYKLIEEIHAALDRLNIGHYIHERRSSVKNSKHKDSKTIYIVGFKRTEKFLNILLPLMRGKKRKVIQVIQKFIERRLSVPQKERYASMDFEYINQVRALNKKGTEVSSETIRQTPLGEDIVQTA